MTPLVVAAVLVALAPSPDDARKAVAVGAGGEVYAPDGKGNWIHQQQIATADPLALAGRAGAAVVALGNGIVYRLADNGWSAVRLHQHGRGIMNAGPHAFAAVGKTLYALDHDANGEPAKLVDAPSPILAIGAGSKGIVVALDTGLFRVTGTKLLPIKDAPAGLRLISDRWALAAHGIVDLATMKAVPWPSGLSLELATTTPDDALAGIARSQAGLELVVLRNGKLARDALTATGTPVGVVLDRANRAVVAFADGTLAVRDKAGWTTTQVSDSAPAARPGPGPASSE